MQLCCCLPSQPAHTKDQTEDCLRAPNTKELIAAYSIEIGPDASKGLGPKKLESKYPGRLGWYWNDFGVGWAWGCFEAPRFQDHVVALEYIEGMQYRESGSTFVCWDIIGKPGTRN